MDIFKAHVEDRAAKYSIFTDKAVNTPAALAYRTRKALKDSEDDMSHFSSV